MIVLRIKQKLSRLKLGWLGRIIAIWLVWFVVVMLVRTSAVSVIHQPTSKVGVVSSVPFLLQPGIKWDANYYLQIANSGYGTIKSSLPAFFPAFPMITAGLSYIGGISQPVAGYILNVASSLVAMVFLFLIAKHYLKKDSSAYLVVILFAFSPFSYYLLAFYTEAIFCALSFAAFYFATKRNWLAACLLLALLSAVRLPALLVILVVFVEYLDSIGWSYKRLTWNVCYFFLAPLGFLLYTYYLWIHFGDPLMFKNAYKFGWSYQVFEPNIIKTVWINLTAAVGTAMSPPTGWKDGWFEGLANTAMQFGAWVFGVIMLVFGILKKVPISWSVYLASSLILFSINSNFVSVNRYLLPLFPIYIVIAQQLEKKEGWLSGLVLASSAVSLGLMITLFSNGYWTG